MPDKERKTISASQIAALFGVSPYLTKRALYDWAADGIDIDGKENRRMDFGKYVQKYILDQTADKFALEVIANDKDIYARHPKIPVGATIDAHLVCPSRGYGIVEAKSISYMVFKNEWTDVKAPLHIETQLQHQMMIPHPKYGLPRWGIISALIGADEDRRFLERRPDKDVFKRISEEVKQFFADVKAKKRPSVTGHPIELRGLEKLYPIAKPNVVIERPKDDELGEMLRRYKYHRDQRLFNEKEEDRLKIRILDEAKDAGRIVAYGATAKITKSQTFPQTIEKGAGTRVSIKVEEREEMEPLPESGGFMGG